MAIYTQASFYKRAFSHQKSDMWFLLPTLLLTPGCFARPIRNP